MTSDYFNCDEPADTIPEQPRAVAGPVLEEEAEATRAYVAQD